MTTSKPQPRQLSEKEVADLSPAERDRYFQQQAEAGLPQNSPWFLEMFERWKAESEARAQAEKVGDRNVKTLSSGDVRYVSGLRSSDADYQGHDHTQLKGFVEQNLSAEQVVGISDAYHELHRAFDDFGKQLTDAVNKSKGAWEGEAAAAAQGYFTSLSKWADANSQNAKLASETIYDQSTAASSAKNKMPEPVPFSWGDEFESWATSNPLDLADNVAGSFDKQQRSQAAHEEAAGVMKQYDHDLYTAASKQPVFAEPPKFGAGAGTGMPGFGRAGDGGSSRSPGDTGSAGYAGPGGSGVLPGGGAGLAGGSPAAGGEPTPLTPGAVTGSGAGTPASATAPAGYQPATAAPQPAVNANPGLGGMGGMPMAPMGGFGGGAGGETDYHSKVGRGGGFGPGGSGSVPGGAATPGGGASSGMARPGGVGAAEAAAGRGIGAGAGAAGRGGPAGMGGTGAGRGGQGEEDQEHQRPSYLVEGDPDGVFGLDQATAPPVIGE
jgi:hypothetical protein